MKLEAKARLAASTKTVTGPIKVTCSDGNVWDFKTIREYEAWKDGTPMSREYRVMTAMRIGHYEVIQYPLKTAVAKIYVDRHFDSANAPTEESSGSLYNQYVYNRVLTIKRSLLALQKSHNPMMGAVKVDADAELEFFKDHPSRQILGKRTQDWFHRLSAEEKSAYCQKFPGTKFRQKPNIIVP